MEILILCVIIGCIPAAIAKSKGRSVVGWWIYGALLFIVALPHSLMASNLKASNLKAVPVGHAGPPALTADTRACPHCAEMIKRAAVVCRYCGRDVEPAPPTAAVEVY